MFGHGKTTGEETIGNWIFNEFLYSGDFVVVLKGVEHKTNK